MPDQMTNQGLPMGGFGMGQNSLGPAGGMFGNPGLGMPNQGMMGQN
jgi:hypothetical protein